MRTDVFTMRITADERRLIEALAQREERTASDAIRRLIRKAAEHNERAPAEREGAFVVSRP